MVKPFLVLEDFQRWAELLEASSEEKFAQTRGASAQNC
jgi:hypothetical protein